jgi:AcrR family transcriptional regulator
MARTGRRPGNQDTREAILVAARQAFTERGFDATSIRHIAGAAGVDPALVHHYFGTKDQLFLDAVQAPFDPAMIVPLVVTGGLTGIGERIVRTLLKVWDSEAGGAAAALVRSAVSNEAIARMMRDFVVLRVLRPVSKLLPLDPAEAPLRANLVASQVGGLILVRYILKFEPLASAPPDLVVAIVGPTVQRYLTGSLPPDVKPPPRRAPRRDGPAGPATTPPTSGPASARSRRRGPS